MKAKRFFGYILLAGGIVMLLVSNYIKNQVAEGKIKIHKAQKTVNQADSLFSLSPATKDVGKGLTGSAQKKIDAGKQDVEYYSGLAQNLQIFGFILMAAGVVVLVLPMIRKK